MASGAAAQDAPPKVESEEREPPDPTRFRNYHFQQDVECPYCVVAPEHPARRGLHWHEHWSRVGLREYVVAPLLLGSALAVRLFAYDTDEASWTGPILFDGAARDALVFETDAGRSRAGTISDALMWVSVGYPVVVDNIAVTWLGRQQSDVAWQMFVINAQSYALTLALNTVVKRVSNRERPWGERCETDPDPDSSCTSSSRFRSFYSGHAAFTATGAALVCTHHTQLELYKSSVADTATCLTAVAATTATGVLRMSSDNHWASDVIAGHLMGFVSGYVVPTLLYYHEFRLAPERVHEEDLPQGAPKPEVALLPLVMPNALMLDVIGRF